MIEITLPWFDAVLNPNSTAHRMVKYHARKLQKSAAYYLTLEALKGSYFMFQKSYLLDITFYPPDRRKRDRDNNLAALKSALDGIALALKTDDNNFDYKGIRRGEPVKGGKIVIRVLNGQVS